MISLLARMAQKWHQNQTRMRVSQMRLPNYWKMGAAKLRRTKKIAYFVYIATLAMSEVLV